MTQLCTLCMVSLLLYLYDKRHDYIAQTSDFTHKITTK